MQDHPAMTNTEVSLQLGKLWRRLSKEEQQPYFNEADRLLALANKVLTCWIISNLT